MQTVRVSLFTERYGSRISDSKKLFCVIALIILRVHRRNDFVLTKPAEEMLRCLRFIIREGIHGEEDLKGRSKQLHERKDYYEMQMKMPLPDSEMQEVKKVLTRYSGRNVPGETKATGKNFSSGESGLSGI